MTLPETPATASSRNPWVRFRAIHLFDYPRRAAWIWLTLIAAGCAALLWALAELVTPPRIAPIEIVAALLLVALGSVFPVKLPRSPYTLIPADLFVFIVLVTYGVPLAVVAGALEAAIGTTMLSKRLSSRLSSPAATAFAMLACGTAFEAVRRVLVAQGMAAEPATLLAICSVALIPYLLTTGPLTAMMAVKQGVAFRPAELLASSTWVAATYLGAAFLAGLLFINSARHGAVVIGVAAVVVLGLAFLLRSTLRRQETERQSQEALVDEAQREAERSQQRFMAAFEHAAIGMAIVNPEGRVLQVNRALCALLEREAPSLVAQPFARLLHIGDAERFRHQAEQVLARKEAAFSTQLRTVTEGGEECWVVIHCSQYEDPGEKGQCLIYQLHDITSRHLAESRLLYVAHHDSLTDLANRNAFNGRLEAAVERTRLDIGTRFAVLFLDLDRFKMVNDSLGHLAGNLLLREVAQRLQACVRPTDLVARLGGDEFAILLEDLHDPAIGLRLAQRVLEALGRPMALNGTEVVPGASVGITFSDLGYRTVDEVLRDADLAMYEAKASGRGRVAIFDSSMHDKVAQKLALEADLRRAIGEGQLTVHFQPIFELEPYRLCGFEALARWVHPQRGPVSPAVFIALAEESGHIEALTDWIIDQSLAYLSLWHRTVPAAQGLGVHVNISGRDLARASLVAYVQRMLQRHAVAAGSLTLEITETTLMGRLDVALHTMGRLREMGVHFSIDDFGTGYSSLSYLSTLPIDSLKIDRSFVMGMHDSPQNVEIVRAVLNLGLSLGRRVIAEGIETLEQLDTLRQLGVPAGQGYLLSRPLGAEQVLELLSVGCVPPSSNSLIAPAPR